MNEEIKAFLNNEMYVLVYRCNYDRAYAVNQQLIDYVKKLQQENNQLKDNWNKLKQYCEEATFYYTTGNGEYKTEMMGNARNGIDILNRMQELEQGSDSNDEKRL